MNQYLSNSSDYTVYTAKKISMPEISVHELNYPGVSE